MSTRRPPVPPPTPRGREARNYGLRCQCGGTSRVIESRTCSGEAPERGAKPALPFPYRRRRHECARCGERWSTLEARETDLT